MEYVMKDLLKKYRHGWILLYFFPYCAWFIYLETAKFDFYEIRCSVDDYIPSIDLFVIPYLLWFVYVALTVSVFFFTDRTDFYRCTAFLFIGMTICLTIFTLFPSTFDRGEEFSDATICGFLVRLIHRIDSNTNVFPSIHCFNSIVCTITYLKSNTFRTTKNSTKKQKSRNRMVKAASAILTVLICLSTVFIKQHSVLDFFGASALALIMYPFIYKISWKRKNALEPSVK